MEAFPMKTTRRHLFKLGAALCALPLAKEPAAEPKTLADVYTQAAGDAIADDLIQVEAERLRILSEQMQHGFVSMAYARAYLDGA